MAERATIALDVGNCSTGILDYDDSGRGHIQFDPISSGFCANCEMETITWG